MPGTLFVVATPIGNLEDITARALRVLREVALIAAEDTRRTARLLGHYAITTPTTSLHEHNESRRIPALLARLEQGQNIALVSDAGTPTISDPGHRLVRAAGEAGCRVEPIPGPSALMAALAASGFPAEQFTFLGFPPTKARDRAIWLEQLKSSSRTVVFFEAPHRIMSTLEALRMTIGDARRICVARELTKLHEELVIGPIYDVLRRLGRPLGEFTVVVDIGQTTDFVAPGLPPDTRLLHELGLMTENGRSSRRQAIALLARRFNSTPNEIYAAIERAKNRSNA
jgi:16S rRNA (cytidine1402-2'-O)-methyltransferase